MIEPLKPIPGNLISNFTSTYRRCPRCKQLLSNLDFYKGIRGKKLVSYLDKGGDIVCVSCFLESKSDGECKL